MHACMQQARFASRTPAARMHAPRAACKHPRMHEKAFKMLPGELWGEESTVVADLVAPAFGY